MQRTPCVYIAVGLKIDLERKVLYEEARGLFASLCPPVQYFEASAKTGQGVHTVFQEAVTMWQNGPDDPLLFNSNEEIEKKVKSDNHDGCVIC